MASGDQVVDVLAVCPPDDDAATFDVLTGGSTPAGKFPVWDFPAAGIAYLDFLCRLTGKYAGGGLTWLFKMSNSSASGGFAEVRWEVGVRRIHENVEIVTTSHSYVYQGVTIATSDSVGQVRHGTVAMTSGAQMDSWAADELAMVRVRRKVDHADDDATGDAELWPIAGKET